MTSIGNKEVFARNLIRYIERSGKTQKELAELVGVAQSTFNDWCKAKKYPRIDKIEILANYFGVLKSDLIEDKKENPAIADGISEMKRIFIERVMQMSEEQLDRLDQIMKLVENPAPKGKD